METITFNNLPEAVGMLLEEVKELRNEVKRLTIPSKEPEYLTLAKAAEYLGMSISALRQNKNIPSKKQMGKIFFKRLELEAFLESGRVRQKATKKFITK